MKNYDERIESIFRKYDARLAEKKRRKAIIRRVAASTGVCAAAIGAVWVISGDSIKNAMKQDFPDNIIVEEAEPSAETTAPAKPVTTNAVTYPRIETSTAVAPKTSDLSSASINTAPISSTAAKRPDTTAPSSDKSTPAVITNVVTDIPTATTAKTNIVTDIPTAATTKINVVAAVITTTEKAPLENASPSRPTSAEIPHENVSPSRPESAEKIIFYRFTDDKTDIQYTMQNLSVPADIIDSFIKTVRLTEETQAESSVISCNADIFTIEGISREAMIALRYEKNDNYIIYRNQNYTVNTFGEFADSFAFNKYVRFKSAENFNGDKIYGFDEDAVKKILSENSDARAVDLYSLTLDKLYVEIRSRYEFADNRSFLFRLGISQNGYITTNLTGREIAFCIGEDTADELIKLIEADSSQQ